VALQLLTSATFDRTANIGWRYKHNIRLPESCGAIFMIRKLKSGKYRLYSRKKDARTGKRKNLGTFNSRAAAKKHERAVQYFKRH